MAFFINLFGFFLKKNPTNDVEVSQKTYVSDTYIINVILH